MPPQRGFRLNRRRDAPVGIHGGLLLPNESFVRQQYDPSAIVAESLAAAAGLGREWEFPHQREANPPSIIVPIVCPYPVPLQEWNTRLHGVPPTDTSSWQALFAQRGGGGGGASSLLNVPPPSATQYLQELQMAAEAQAAIPVVPDAAVSSNALVARHEEPTFQDDVYEDDVEDDFEEDDPSAEEHRTKYTEAWDSMFERLLRYKWKHGDCLVPTHYKKDPKLGRWVMNQRHKKAQLSPARRQRLRAIGFVWCVKQQETWDAMFERLLKYKMMYGDCLVPQKYKEDTRLGEWVQTQRRDKKRRRNLSPDRQARLDAIGFEWCPHNFIWDAMFARLCSFKHKYGSCLVPRHFEDDPKLGRWVDQQRVKNKKGNLTPERKRMLDSLGFVWKMR